ncbi:exodeoxyribonuclease V subunit beta [Geomonas sp. RF6]|uniref:exodeoxyribonuclease V subunit beta n=1 Tax=Geomonas sp. RF6 TaxID=2897342 RepID=UPI001E3CBE81|nr:exodeoxyribonuclease V subunit beta [Geomonas sp. RF6]UFS70144.1 exodeoxyribonuclease V subunit beta [Geomonas sp. RF6]
MKELDHLHIDLSGRNLIEASAGTGKTYAIACLYLRLLVELDLPPEKILVVTYTEAATEELRGRIRARIREALSVFDGAATDDLFLSGLAQNASGKGPCPEVARDRLDRALKSFDLASIFTIHGFCLRALQDNAFESGSLYDTELVTDQSDLLQEIVDDFWRSHFFADPAPLLSYALRKGLSPPYFVGFLKGMLGNPKLEVVPHFDLAGLPALETECREAFAAVAALWQGAHEEVRELLETHKGLSRAQGKYHPDSLPELFDAMECYLRGAQPYEVCAGFEKFTVSGILAGKKPSGAAPEHRFFERCEELLTILERRFLALKCELLDFARERLPARKRERNVRCFDDLLTSLYDALKSERGADLALALRQKYRAALIDEFQDTDPVQFDIFRTIYSDADSPLFLIGDPKQAIYSFRGADIFAYLEAAADVEEERRFTLTSNWRSTPRLLDAFNTVFEDDLRPFIFGQISYHPVKYGKKEGGDRLVLPDADDAPLQLWHLPEVHNGREVNVGVANDIVPGAVAAEIARLLRDGAQGKALIGEKPLLPEHIAVIVRSHRQAACMQEALSALSIPSVMRSDKSVLTSREARELCTLLAALASPGSEPKVRAALVIDILGVSGDGIAELLEDEPRWEEWLARFREYHQLWVERGFMVMVQALMSREGVRGRLLARSDGERRLTNLLHCFEILHAATQERSLGAEGAVTWFGERISAEDAAEEYQIRLETDEKAVKILTIHVSKGLEYPVVFCPFLWGGIRSGDEIITFHDDYRLIKDFGSPDRSRNELLAQKESLAENLRLLYVALTRAKFRCYVVGGRIADKTGRNRPETSPLAYLFHASTETRTSTDVVGSLAREVKKLSCAGMVQQLRDVAGRNPGAISVSPLPEPDAEPFSPMKGGEEAFSALSFSRHIDRDWRVSSFTSFAAHDGGAELPDRDQSGEGEAQIPAAPPPEPQGMSIFTFPRGARAGIFLHEIFEKLDFAGASEEKTADLVRTCLEAHHFSDEWAPSISSMVRNVVTAPLAAPGGTFSLSDLQQDKWLSELEFFFPLRFVTSGNLKSYFQKWSGQHRAVDLLALCSQLRFRPAKGMVRGFIDLVFEHDGRFYLVDWKSNHLGNQVEDYRPERLAGAMEQKLYPLQYLLYTVALNRFLKLRVPGYSYESHFGGVLYFFLRGVRKDRGEEFGIFRDTPPREMIDELTSCLIEAGG